MKALDILSRLQRMDQLIRLKATGNPKEFAARLGISESLLYVQSKIVLIKRLRYMRFFA